MDNIMPEEHYILETLAEIFIQEATAHKNWLGGEPLFIEPRIQLTQKPNAKCVFTLAYNVLEGAEEATCAALDAIASRHGLRIHWNGQEKPEIWPQWPHWMVAHGRNIWVSREFPETAEINMKMR